MKKIPYALVASDATVSSRILAMNPKLLEGDIVSREDQICFRREVCRCIGGDYDPVGNEIYFSDEEYLLYLLKWKNA